MKTIIAATDFSPAAMNAVTYASDMATSIGVDLLLVHVWKIPISDEGMPVPILTEDVLEIAKKRMSDLETDLINHSKRKINISSRIRMGEFVDELIAICKNINPYVVVMGSQGTTAAERVIFGSHAVQAMKKLQWPMITVPKDVTYHSIKKIGLACDYQNVVETIPTDEIKTLVKDFNASLHILNTGKEKTADPEVVFQSGLLQELILDLKPSYHFITGDDADIGIMDFAENNKIDLLIILPKRHSLPDKLIHRSHTKQFVLHSHVPVMALHQ